MVILGIKVCFCMECFVFHVIFYIKEFIWYFFIDPSYLAILLSWNL